VTMPNHLCLSLMQCALTPVIGAFVLGLGYKHCSATVILNDERSWRWNSL
jgi:hypothetical protein